MLTRREALKALLGGLSATTYCAACGPALAEWPSPSSKRQSGGSPAARTPSGASGCTLASAEAWTVADIGEISLESGIPQLDPILRGEAQVLSYFTGMQPGFGFFDDVRGPNAFATPALIIPTGIHGTVAFGRQLLAGEMGQVGTPQWGVSVAGIMAHEWAHIMQFHFGVINNAPINELHADYCAGWYMATKMRTGMFFDMEQLGWSLFNKGDYEFFSQGHHGTPQQRVSAMLSGVQFAGAFPYLNFEQAFRRGIEGFQR